MEKIKINEISNLVATGKFDTNIIERKYIPINEKEQRINRLIDSISLNYSDELEKVIEIFEENNPIVNKVLLQTEIIDAYTALDFDTENMEEVIMVYDTLSEHGLIDKLIDELNDAQEFENLFYSKLNAHRDFKEKEYFSQNINVLSCLDELVPHINDLLITLNEKTSKLNVDKINADLDKVNFGELFLNRLKLASKGN